MLPGAARGNTAARGARQEPLLDEIGLDHVLERARTEWLRAQGHSQIELAADPGVLFAVAEVNIRYRRPARLDDLLVISCQPAPGGGASVVFAQQIRRDSADGELLAEASVRVVCVDARDFTPRRLPPGIFMEES